MATIHKLTKDGSTIFPATITDAIVHPSVSKTLTSMIKDYNVSELFPTEGVGGGNTYTLSLAIQVLGTHLRTEEKTGGLKLKFISSTSSNCEEEYYLTKSTWSTSISDWEQKFGVGDVIGDPVGSWTPGTAEAYVDQKIAEQNQWILGQETKIDLNKNLISQEMQARQNRDAELTDLINEGIRVGEGVQFDNTPTSGSVNAVTSNGIFQALYDDSGAYNVTLHHPTSGVSGGATYTLALAFAAIPSTVQRGGLTIKFIDSTSLIYSHYRLNTSSWPSTFNESDWTSMNVDDTPTQFSNNLVKSGGVLNQDALFLSSIFKKPTLVEQEVGNGRRIKKTDGKAQYITGINSYITSWIKIQEGCDIFAFGKTNSIQTSLALYSNKNESSFIQAEQNNDFVHIKASELEAIGAKYCRGTISGSQKEDGNWFYIVKNIEDVINDIISVYSDNITYNGNDVTLTSIDVFKNSGEVTTIYADKLNQQPVTFSLINGSLILVIDSENNIVTRTNSGDLKDGDVILLAYSLSESRFYRGLLLSDRNIQTSIQSSVQVLTQNFTPNEKRNARDNIDAAYKYILNEKNISLNPISNYTIDSGNNWYYNKKYNSTFIPIVAGVLYEVIADKQVIISVLTTNETSEHGAPVTTFASGFDGRITVPAGGSYSFVCPEDGRYLYVLLKGNSGNLNPSIFETENLEDFIIGIQKKVDEIKAGGIDNLGLTDSSKRRVADSLGNALTPLTIPVDTNGYEIPTTREILNVQKKSKQMTDIVWTPLADIPYQGTGGVFPANVPVTGLPYSSVKEIDKYIGFDVSIHTFMTAVNNPYSLLYTECVLKTRSASAWGRVYNGVDNCAAYMGTVCSVLSGYGTGQVVQWPTAEDKWCAEINLNMVKVYEQKAQGLRIGDIIWIPGHNRLVVGLKRDSNGEVTHVQITESTGSHVRQNADITAQTFNNKLSNEGGIIYRNIEIYKNRYAPSEFVAVGDETITPYIYNDDICTFAGDKATFRESDLIVLNYNLKSEGNWTAIKVFKDDVLVNTYQLSEIDQSELPEGQRNHALKLGNTHTYGQYKACMTDGTVDSEFTYWEVLETNVSYQRLEDTSRIEWSSENASALSWTICDINGTVYSHNEFSLEEIEEGHLDINLLNFNSRQYPNRPFSGNMYLKIHFEGRFGRVTNEPFVIEI